MPARNQCDAYGAAGRRELLLRIAAIIQLLFTAGHSMGGLKQWSPMGENPALRSMREVRFDTMGANGSYLDFFMGFGWSISVFMPMETILWFAPITSPKRSESRIR